jgi:hypothetical protein
MPSTSEREAAAARQFYSVILAKLTNEKGVHAETAIAGAARMAGTFLMRSFNLALDHIAPGTPVLSDIANEKGPKLVELLEVSLEQLQIRCDPQKLATAPQGYTPLLDLLATQALLEPAMNQVCASHQLNYEQAARAATITTSQLIQQCQQIVDPHTSFKLAAYSFVEGCKTAPQRLPAAPANEVKKPWFKLW